MTLDFKKYKRAFAFGCSFTKYAYPTWADLIFNEIDGKCYNFGKQGSGNLAIASRIAEANKRFKFTEYDLVMVMYSSSCREDRYIDGQWQTYGNLYQSGYYDKNFVKNYVDPIGHIIRDLSLIDLSSKYIKSLPCDNIILYAFDINGEDANFRQSKIDDVLNVYIDSNPTTSVEKFLFPNGLKARTAHIQNGTEFIDVHPTTMDYLTYLSHIGIEVSQETKSYAYACEQIINEKLNFDKPKTIYQKFPEIFDRWDDSLF